MGSVSDPRASKSTVIPKRRQDVLKWNGWGYKDTRFVFNVADDVCEVTGDRYKISGHKLPLLKEWFGMIMGASLDRKSPAQPEMTADQIPNAIVNEPFLVELKQTQISYSDDPQDRLYRAHGHTMDELFILRYGKFERIPDLVCWPGKASLGDNCRNMKRLNSVSQSKSQSKRGGKVGLNGRQAQRSHHSIRRYESVAH